MPDRSTAFRLALYYRAIATVSFLVGGVFILAGLWLGFADAVDVLLGSFLEDDMTSDAMAAANPLVAVVLVVVGTVIWQVGKATALHWTLATAVEADAPAARTAAPTTHSGGAVDRRHDVEAAAPDETQTGDGPASPAPDERDDGETHTRGQSDDEADTTGDDGARAASVTGREGDRHGGRPAENDRSGRGDGANEDTGHES